MGRPAFNEALQVGKRFDTARARAAMAGWSLTVIEDDRGRPEYVLTRGAICQRFDSLDAADRWLASVDAAEVSHA